MIYPKLSDGTIDWCVMCKHEGSAVYDLCCECEYPENSDDPPTKYEPKLITNADRIRAMMDEELADEILRWFNWLNAVEWDDKRIIGWLKQEAAE